MMEYITTNASWIMTFIGLESICFVINFVWMKRDRKAKYDLKRQATVGIIETTIILAAIIYAGAPAWVIWSVVALIAVSIGSVFALKLKYGL